MNTSITATEQSPEGLKILKAFLDANPDVKTIQYQVVDYSGVARCRMTTVARALSIAAKTTGPVLTGSPLLSCLNPYEGFWLDILQPDNDLWHPDWTSLRKCTYTPGHARVMCNLEAMFLRSVGSAFDEDPRTILQRALDHAQSSIGATFEVGFEVEFQILDSAETSQDCGRPFPFFGSRRIMSQGFSILEEIVEALEDAGVSVWGFHTEGHSRGFEIALTHKAPMQAVDDLIFTEEAIKHTAAKHGMFATLHPKLTEDAQATGLHTNVSISKSEAADSFLAGVLKHWRALSLLAQSNFDSYARVSGSKIAWGQAFKVNCINQCRPGLLELRTPDAFANKHFLLAGIIGCVTDAILNDEKLTMKPNQRTYFGEQDRIIDDHLKSLGVTERTPENLGEAIEAFKQDEILGRALGKRAFEKYAEVKKRENETAKNLTTDARRAKMLDFI